MRGDEESRDPSRSLSLRQAQGRLRVNRRTQNDTTPFFRMESTINWEDRQENKGKVAGAYMTPATWRQ